MKKRLNLLREFSVPLIAGVVVALIWANISPESFHRLVHTPLVGPVDFEFIANEIFMVFFFGIAAVEITQGCLPGGDLNPPEKALNPLMATIGGVIGPVAVYLLLNTVIGTPELHAGWGVPTATDIALAWLVARLIFGATHPVITYLLLLAIADDAIGLVIITIFYPDPSHPVVPLWLLATGVGMLAAYFLRSQRVVSYWPYLLLGGGLSWLGLFQAHLHPALALVFIVPFMPHPPRENNHMFEADDHDPSTLSRFEHEWKVVVDFGLFIFGLANAGVPLSGVGTATVLVLTALIIGKTGGITLFGWLGQRLGFPLPKGMEMKHLIITGVISAVGFTVAIFVAGAAFSDPHNQGAAKMGAILSILAAPLAWLLARQAGITSGKQG